MLTGLAKSVLPRFVVDWVRLSRWREWAESKLVFIAATCLLLSPPKSSSLLLAEVAATVICWAAFGYAINDVADRGPDLLARRPNRAADLTRASRGSFLVVNTSAALGLSFVWGADTAAPALVSIGLALAGIYSMPPLRLKERGVLGLVTPAAAQWCLPVLAVSAIGAFGWLRPEAWAVALWGFAIGMRWIAVHQRRDAAADRTAGVHTYATDRRGISDVIRDAFVAEWTLMGAALLLTFPRSIPAIAALGAWFLFEVARPSAGQSFEARMFGYEQAPLGEYYFVLLPFSLAASRARSSPMFLLVAAAFLVRGWPYFRREWAAARGRTSVIRGAASRLPNRFAMRPDPIDAGDFAATTPRRNDTSLCKAGRSHHQ